MTPQERENILIRILECLLGASEVTYKMVPSFMKPKLVTVRRLLDEVADLLGRLKAG